VWLAQYPDVAWLLKYVYLSSFPQLLALLLLLGLLGRVDRLHQFLLTGMMAGVLTIGFWTIWPSFGPSAYLQIDPQVIAAAHLLVTPDYGANLMDLAQNGIGRIEKHQMLGTVAFPSFHIVMAFMAAWFARGTWLFWPYLVLNILMVPATLTHGGHHLIDVFGGVAMFAACYALSGWAVRATPTPERVTGRLSGPVGS
jgi:membrane-associated phospholipid phosphatase